ASPDQFTFMTGRKYLDDLKQSRAGAVIVSAEFVDSCPVDHLVSDNPYLSYARASQLFDCEPRPDAGVHASAVVADGVTMGKGVAVGPLATIDAGATLGDGVIIGAGAHIGANVTLGDNTRIFPKVVLYHDVALGRDCVVHSQTVIGVDGFGYAPSPEGWVRICQSGSVRIGDRVEIGSSCTIDRGALEDTVIGDGVIVDDQVHIAHNCVIGKNTAIAGCVGIAGSTTIGENCTFAGQVGISGHLTIADNTHLTGQARVTKSISEPGVYSSGTPLMPSKEWARNAARIKMLAERFSQIDLLRQQVAELEAELNNKED
ncbi:MAG: UDP-3-O-(3-hydroxymyristoyl)glucosamine N-acyltransferase, partial [Halieaceae bacterium]